MICSVKVTVKSRRRHAIEGKKVFTNQIKDSYLKELSEQTNKSNQRKAGEEGKGPKQFTKEGKQTVKKHRKRRQASESMEQHYESIKIALNSRMTTSSTSGILKQLQLLTPPSRNTQKFGRSGKQ